jgi:hypothetical protein
MLYAVDSHVHFYPCYDEKAFFSAAFGNLGANCGGQSARFLVLTERSGCQFFAQWRKSCPFEVAPGVKMRALPEDLGLEVASGQGEKLVILAGRQICTVEGLEIHALGSVQTFPDGVSFNETLSSISASGAIASIPWGLGKWCFKRKKVLWAAMEAALPGGLLWGDSALRPLDYLGYDVLRRAQSLGYTVLAGSDPLPLCGEERRVGCYISSFEADYDVKVPVASFLSALRSKPAAVRALGRRQSLVSVGYLSLGLMLGKLFESAI